MAVTTFQGTIENGQVRLTSGIRLPEKAKVYIVIPDFEQTESHPKFDLNEMLARMPADYQPHEEDFGKPVGKEEW